MGARDKKAVALEKIVTISTNMLHQAQSAENSSQAITTLASALASVGTIAKLVITPSGN